MHGCKARTVLSPLVVLIVLAIAVLAVDAMGSSEAQSGSLYGCPGAGRWSIAVWDGPGGTSMTDALGTCGSGAVEAAYYLDPASQNWLRWFSGRPDISNLATLNDLQGVIALGSASASPGSTAAPPASEDSVQNCPLAGKWAISVWSGQDAVGADQAFASCGAGAVGAAYYLDPQTGGWVRWFQGRPDISNLTTLNNLQGVVALGRGRIAFQSNRLGGGVYAMNSDGSGQTRLTASADMPAWSPDGSKIAFSTTRDRRMNGDLGGNFEIYVMNADGSSQTRLTTNDPAVDYMPAWSPDGRRIAFASDRDNNASFDIYVMNADGTGQTRLTNNAAEDCFPSWSPDGSRIAFASSRDDAPGGEIYVMNADGSGQTRITNNKVNDSSPAWSPDGSRIAFTSDDEIYVMNADGSGQTRLTNNSASDLYPAWSPDGSRIAFTSWRDGNEEIYVMNADGSGQTNLSNNPANDLWPAWSP